MERYYIKSNLGWLSSHNGVRFEYWTEYSNRDAQRYIFIFAWLKLQLIKLLWKIEKTNDRLYLEKVGSTIK